MTFEPKDPDFEKSCIEKFNQQPTMKSLGVKLMEVTPGKVSFEMPFNPAFSQQHGFVHGGIIATVLDSACGYAAQTLIPAKSEILTIEFKTNFLSPARSRDFRFEGHVVKPGRNIVVTEATAFALEDGKEKEIAIMTATMMAVHNREDVVLKNTQVD